MRSNFEPLGKYIRKVNDRNDNSEIETLKGINIDKEFMPSVANTIGSNMAKYRVVSQWQFAYNPMHVGRDEVLPISMLKDDTKVIVSPAYTVFEIEDHNQLNPEYLMMWCRRSEFDRNAWFTTDNSVRGGFSWESLCEMELPVPSIEKQREIVAEYNAVVDRIELNEEINQKLEETAKAIYRQWFEEFEFPISKEYAESIGKPELEGQPYKSNGGEMVYNEELDGEIPKGWEVNAYEDVMDFTTGKLNSNAAVQDGEYPFFTCSQETFRTNTFSFDCRAVLLAGNNASAVYPLKYYEGKFDAYQRTYVVTPTSEKVNVPQIYFSLRSQLKSFEGTSSGTATKFLTKKLLLPIKILIGSKETREKFNLLGLQLLDHIQNNSEENESLLTFSQILLSRMSVLDEKAMRVA